MKVVEYTASYQFQMVCNKEGNHGIRKIPSYFIILSTKYAQFNVILSTNKRVPT